MSRLNNPLIRAKIALAPITIALLFMLGLLILEPIAPAVATDFVPPNFVETLVAQGFKTPTNMAVAPDGRVFVLEQQTVSGQGRGYVRVVKNGVLLSTPFVTINGIDIQGERGLLGIEFDPNFATNGFVYLFYTLPGTPGVTLHNEVWRYTANPANKDVALAGSGLKIIQFPPIDAAFHVGGSMHFNPIDGKLYISIGEDWAGDNEAQDIDEFRGRILRYTINANGTFSAPSDNPWFNQATTTVNKGSWAMGFRNPFQFAIQPTTGLMYVNDVGQDLYEEINNTQKGKHYGWKFCEGPCSPANSAYTSPIHYYGHTLGGSTNGGCAITGSIFYNPLTPTFPAAYIGKYFYADYCNNWIKYINPSTPSQVSVFATRIYDNTVALDIAPNGSLYYLSRGLSSSDGRLFRIDYALNGLPTFNQHPANKNVSAGQTAAFTCNATGGTPITYQWQRRAPGAAQFLNIGGATSTTYTTAPTTVEADNGAQFRCQATNPAGSAFSQSATLSVVPGTPPVVAINVTINDTARQTWLLGDTVDFTFTATDAQEGTLPASAFTWSVDLYHQPPASATHTHPILPSTSGSSAGSFAISPTPHDRAHYWYRINVRATDSSGLFTDAIKIVESSLIEPTYNILTSSTRPIMNWRPIPGAIGYELYIGLDDTPDTKVTVPGLTTRMILPVTLISTRTYYWYVKVLFPGGASVGTDTWRFQVVSAANGGPLRNYFTNGRPSFSWSRIVFATGYHLQIATETTFAASTVVYEAVISGGTTLEHQLGTADALTEGVYFWRVAPIRADGVTLGVYNAAQIFTVKLN
jgi:glucose/arabinose dehydrogenase